MGLRGLVEATRPWSFPMTLLVSLTVIAYAASTGRSVDPLLSLAALAGGVLLHAAANLFNDYFDYRYGVDRPGVGTAIYRAHPILSGTLTPPSLLAYTLSLAAAGLALAAAAAPQRPAALPLALLGLAAAYSYTGPPARAKYR
nr:UbiA family prenyltransferase [Desulfurococcales archaeon]